MSYIVFDVIIQVVMFDFIPENLIDYGFSETNAWSDKFVWLDYDSGNFVELLGSLSFFFMLFAV